MFPFFKRVFFTIALFFLCCFSFKDNINDDIAYKRKAGPKWLKTAIIYQIYPQSFKDSDGDGIGDLKGMLSKVDYIKSLGVDLVWLNPVFESQFRDGGYDVTDYYKVDRRYGTNADLKNLVAGLHRNGLKLCLDLVAGHTSDEHPWFKASAKSDSDPLARRYIWTNSKTVKPERFVEGSGQRNGTYEKNFFDFQPALNFGYANPNPKHPWEDSVSATGPQSNIAEMKTIISFWMDQGVDGFRVDMAAFLIKGDTNYVETYKLWGGIRQWFDKKYPEGVLIAEWGNPSESVKAGFNVDFLLHFNSHYSSLFFNEVGTYPNDSCFFDSKGKGDVKAFVDEYLLHTANVGYASFISVPSANHDFQRPACGRRKGEELNVVMAFLLTWPGVPTIYYGDEIGMRFLENLPDKEGSVLPVLSKGNRAGSRTPMQWNATTNAGFSTASNEKFYLPVDPDPAFPNVSSQAQSSGSLLNFVRKLIKLRKSSPALNNCGRMVPLFAEKNKYPFVYSRESDTETYIVAINPSENVVTANFSFSGVSNLTPVMVKGSEVQIRDDKIVVKQKGVSYGIYKVVMK